MTVGTGALLRDAKLRMWESETKWISVPLLERESLGGTYNMSNRSPDP